MNKNSLVRESERKPTSGYDNLSFYIFQTIEYLYKEIKLLKKNINNIDDYIISKIIK